MGLSHVGDQAAGGFSGFGQGLDVARVAGAHLDNGNLMHDTEAEKCLGHAHVVVEVALGCHLVITLGQDGAHEFLGRCLAVGAGDADDRDVKAAAVLTCHVLVGLQCVGDENHLFVTVIAVIYLLIVDDSDGATFVQGLGCKLVAVKRFALQGDKDAAFGTIAAIGSDYGMLFVDFVEFLAIHILFIFILLQKYKNNPLFYVLLHRLFNVCAKYNEFNQENHSHRLRWRLLGI